MKNSICTQLSAFREENGRNYVRWVQINTKISLDIQCRPLESYYKSSSVCLFVCLSVCSLSPPRSFDRSSPNLVGVCRWTSELPLRGSFSKRSTGRRVNGSLSLSTILYICQPHSTQLQKATLLLQHLIRLKGTFCCIDGWWVYLGGSRNCLLDGSSMACNLKFTEEGLLQQNMDTWEILVKPWRRTPLGLPPNPRGVHNRGQSAQLL